MTFRQTFGILFAGMLMLGIAKQMHAGEAEQRHCSNATLQGDYSFTTTGTLNGVPLATVGKSTFDGKGSFQSTETLSDNGVISENLPGTGTYTVNADCTGTSMISTGRASNFVIVDNGNEIQAINAAPGTVLITVLKRLFTNRWPDFAR
ncbi:MAG: hypothetical protein JO319_00320 [Acidobacteriaceae bacterium]|nr:hypothetical protein [Acidobacteriaceae bacterium]